MSELHFGTDFDVDPRSVPVVVHVETNIDVCSLLAVSREAGDDHSLHCWLSLGQYVCLKLDSVSLGEMIEYVCMVAVLFSHSPDKTDPRSEQTSHPSSRLP